VADMMFSLVNMGCDLRGSVCLRAMSLSMCGASRRALALFVPKSKRGPWGKGRRDPRVCGCCVQRQRLAGPLVGCVRGWYEFR